MVRARALVVARGLALLAGPVALVAVLIWPAAGAAQSVNVFIGSATIPNVLNGLITAPTLDATGDAPGPVVSGSSASTANLWMDTDGGTCTRQGTPATYSTSAACATLGDAYTAASTGDTVRIRPGTYAGSGAQGDQTIGTGTKTVSFIGDPVAGRPSFGQLSNSAANVTFEGLLFEGRNGSTDGGGQGQIIRHPTAAASGVTYRDVKVDGNFFRMIGISGDYDSATFDTVEVYDFTNEKAMEMGGTDMLMDGLVVHDVRRDSYGASVDVHNECWWSGNADGLTMRNSRFYNCETMDVAFTGWIGEPITADNNVTIENSVFAHPTQWNDGSSTYSWHGSPNAISFGERSGNYTGWLVRNVTIEGTTLIHDPATPSGNTWTSNLGGWACESGFTYSYNVGDVCGGTNSVSVSPSSNSTTPPAAYDWVAPTTFDFHIGASSQAIGAANPANYTTTDADGQSRDGDPDAGAYEYP